jgi:hypothetical protein
LKWLAENPSAQPEVLGDLKKLWQARLEDAAQDFGRPVEKVLAVLDGREPPTHSLCGLLADERLFGYEPARHALREWLPCHGEDASEEAITTLLEDAAVMEAIRDEAESALHERCAQALEKGGLPAVPVEELMADLLPQLEPLSKLANQLAEQLGIPSGKANTAAIDQARAEFRDTQLTKVAEKVRQFAKGLRYGEAIAANMYLALP